MSDLIDTTEMYLKAIWEMGEDGIPALRARLTERLEQSGPTVSQTVARMERDGLIVLREDRLIEFTRLGAVYAMRVMRKHRLSELLLLEVLGLDFAQVHEEACRWEHVVGREAEERIARLVADPRRDPYGNPVPGLGELGLAAASGGHGRAVADGGAQEATVVRIGEALQADGGLLRLLRETGVLPGARVTVVAEGNSWLVGLAGSEGSGGLDGLNGSGGLDGSRPVLELAAGAARHLFVDS